MGADGTLVTSQLDVGQALGHNIAVTTGASLQANASFDATGMHVTFEEDGRIVGRIEDLDATITGTAGGTDFSVEVEDADTGEVAFTEEGIEVPALSIPTLRLHDLAWTNGTSLEVSLQSNGLIEMTGITADVHAHYRPVTNADGSRSMESIEIKSLVIPTSTASGLDIELTQKGIGIEVPADKTATISDIRLTDYLIILPATEGGAMEMTGRADVGAFDVEGLRIAMEGTQLWTDIHARTLEVHQLSDGSTTFDLNSLTAENIHGTTNGSDFRVTSVTVDGIEGEQTAEGDLTVDTGEVVVSGITYDDGNILLEITSATLPEGVHLPAGDQIVIPELSLNRAEITIRDLEALTEGGDDSPGAITDFSFLDTLDGHFNFDMKLAYHLDYVFPIRYIERAISIDVENGEFHAEDIESDLGGTEGWALDFEYDEDSGTYYLEADWLFGSMKLIEWDLESNGSGDLAEDGRIRFRDMMAPEVMPGAEETDEDAEEEDGAFELFYVHLENIDARFDMDTPSDIPLRTGGVIHLGDEDTSGLVGLTARGLLRLSGGETQRSSRITLGLEQLNASLDNLNVGGNLVDVGELSIGPISGATIRFEGMTPKRFHCVIDGGTASGIRVLLAGD